MIVFNGNVITGGSINLNGRSISGLGTGNPKNFDEWKSEDDGNVEKILIDSTSIPVNISVSNLSKVEAHFYGQADIDGNIDFDFNVKNRELRIALEFTGNCYNSSLKLDVTVPHKIFKAITAKTLSADITLNEGVSTEYLKVKTQSGDLETFATFTNASITTVGGDVELYIDAKKDIALKISTMGGDVKNRHKGVTGYTANVDISAMGGDIRIR